MKQRKLIFLIVGISALVAFSLAIFIGMKQSVWFDEAYSILVSQQSPAEAVALASVDTHPPLYYLLLHTWGGLFGWSELSVRSLSALALGGLVVASATLARKLFGWRAGVLTAVLVAISPMLLRYGFEVRMYSVATLIGCLATLTLVYASEAVGRRKLWLMMLYAVLVAVGTMTLYNLVYVWLAHVAWLLYRYNLLKKGERRELCAWFGIYASSVILTLPWLPTLFRQITNGALAPISETLNLANLIGVVTFNSLYQPIWMLGPVMSLVALAYFVALGYLLWSGRGLFSKSKNTLLPLFYFLVPIGVLTLVSLAKPLYVERYLSFVAVAFSMTVAVLLAEVWRKPSLRKLVASGVVVITMLLGVIQLSSIGNFNFQRLQHPEVREVVSFVQSQCDFPETIILASDPYVATEMQYYLPKSCELNFYSPHDSLGGGYAPIQRLAKQVKDIKPNFKAPTRKVIIVYYGETDLHLNGRVIEKQSWGNLRVDIVNVE